ncbi:TIGR03013 family XrtA/PEP-CTERM system glycosyltransferase [Allochromatium palmeri]|uniref:TIGR03013 family PEP-CTERM/XrtA system glycosyltransferase n=1 Tax=Allochromatium palmeri TaxID=231048 RepID=A0A6N8EA70_9GAMM|nr:TIGR03013 family XrtA/PEP-CTERM system glycosyltransferase [Allochromatium palmeri]MTW21183.1 TIGR03013 family PEP-CTERM/XrtA system glycosyltransferase [Allochromatium palmeri]
MHSIRVFGHYMRLPLLLLALVETVLFGAAFILAQHLRFWLMGNEEMTEPLILAGYAIVVALTFMLSMAAMGLYEASAREGLNGLLIRILVSLIFGAALLAALAFIFPGLEFWRSILALTVILSFIAVAGLRMAIYQSRPWLFRRRVLVFGDSELIDEVIDAGADELMIVGVVPVSTDPSPPLSHPEWFVEHDRPLADIALERQADEVLLAVRDRRGAMPMEELLDCRMSGIQVLQPQSFFERELGLVKLDLLNPSWLLHTDGFKHGAMTMFIKRVMDVLTALSFLILFSPVMLLTALAIAVESRFRHPIFYRQVRVGINGFPFEVIKFRSMRMDAESDGRARWATKGDPRITRVGRFIRKTRIDELPQIINVLKGEMSFVGPRPERPEFVADLLQKNFFYAARSRVKPGLTGWAQLRYPYGSSEEDALRKLEYDLYYVKNHSTFLDLLILLQTVEVVLFGKGAV